MSDDTITYREYHNEITSIVDTIETQLNEQDTELPELVFRMVDTHEWIIYGGYHTEILDHSEPDGWKPLVSDTDDYQQVLRAMAFSAMRKDVWEELHERGIGQ